MALLCADNAFQALSGEQFPAPAVQLSRCGVAQTYLGPPGKRTKLGLQQFTQHPHTALSQTFFTALIAALLAPLFAALFATLFATLLATLFATLFDGIPAPSHQDRILSNIDHHGHTVSVYQRGSATCPR